MSSSEEHNRIDELQQSLYSRTAPDIRSRRKFRFSKQSSSLKTAWERTPEEPLEPVELNKEYKDRSMSFVTKFLIGSIIFCIVAVGIGAYLFFQGSNLISGDNIDIDIRGPVSIPGGAPVAFDITVTNNNNVELEGVDLSIEFPEGTADATDSTRELKTFRELLGDIPSGGKAGKTVQAIIFGEENLQKQIEVTATYKVKGSTALFTKSSSHAVLINSSPLFLTVDSFDEVASGQEFEMKVSLKSNSRDTLKNVILKASYPFGYTFVSSDIKPLADNATWRVGDIPPSSERIIRIRGKLQAEDSETRVFRFSTGAQSTSDQSAIGTQYMSAEKYLTVEKPFVSATIAVNGEDGPGDAISQFGQYNRVVITWFNNLPTAVTNMSIKAVLSGNAYSKDEIRPDQGYFNSANNEIVWDQRSFPQLASVAAGSSGSVSFSLSPRDRTGAGGPLVNPVVNVSVDVSGRRSGGSSVSEKLSSVVTRTIKVASIASLTGRIVRSVGPFENTGPIPPQAERSTTYTVVWTVDNTSSNIVGARVSASLPAHVRWLGKTSPSNEQITYDQNSGVVTWEVGSVGTHTLTGARRREAYFQIALEPGADQVGQSPILVNQAVLTATDSFTGVQLQSMQDPLATRFSTDPEYREGQATVVK